MGRDGQLANCDPDGQKIDKARDTYGARCDAVCLEEGQLVVYKRAAKFYARVRLAPKKYIWRSSKTADPVLARNRARKLFFDFQFRQQHGLPLHSKMMGEVISEYVSMREVSHDQGRTSACMLRQIKRVARFWREFAGSWPVEGIHDKELRDYLDWRRGYYASKESLPKNARLVPADKTLQWEMMLGKAILRWATQKGLRGQRPLPTFSFVPKIKRVRPAFEREEFQRVCRTMIDIINEPIPERWRRSRELLQFYVLFLANCGVRVGEANARSGDPATICESVTRLVVAVASRRPDASASNLKSSVVRMLIATEPEVEPPPTPKGRSRRS